MNDEQEETKIINSAPSFITKLIELEPDCLFEIEGFHSGPPDFGEVSWHKIVERYELLELIKRNRITEEAELNIALYPRTLEKYTLIQFQHWLHEEIDIMRFYEKLKKNYCIGTAFGTFSMLVTHSKKDIETMLQNVPGYKDLIENDGLYFNIYDKDTSAEKRVTVYGDMSLDLLDMSKPLIFDVDFEELFFMIKSIKYSD